jgi:serine O-acetyltransferase
MLDNIRQDCCRISYYSSIQPENIGLYRILFEAIRNAGFRAVFFYRIGHWCRLHKMGFAAVFIERLMHHLCHCWISTVVDVGPGFVIAHVCGIIVDGVAGPIGKNFSIRQNVTIGGNYGKNINGRTQPLIGDNVSVGPGASILGPIAIGSNTIIGANTVVTTDIPENSVVGAFRAEVIGKRADDGSIMREGERVFISRQELFTKIKALEEKIEKLEQLMLKQ